MTPSLESKMEVGLGRRLLRCDWGGVEVGDGFGIVQVTHRIFSEYSLISVRIFYDSWLNIL